ncbi:MAG: hypothetical protein LBD75_05770 [Candidatus Peribacteria bacterium]|jgi:hypothetical protein|nr:hypothetical protein [Candidatus Peribacteria bacterium]
MMLALLSDPDYRPQNPMYINIQDKPPEEDILHYVFKAFLQHFDYSLQQVMPNHPEEVFAPGEYLRIMGEILREKKQEEIMLLFDHIEGLSTAEQQSINNIICTQ